MKTLSASYFISLIVFGACLGCTPKDSTQASSTWSISWSFDDAGGTSTLNKSASQGGSYPVLVSFSSSLYAAWLESNGSKNQIRVKATSDGTSWSFADGGGANGLNIDTTLDATAPAITASDSKIYLAWSEDDGTSTPQVRVKESSNGTTWTSIESGGINVSNTETAQEVGLIYFNSKLYAFWKEYSAGETLIRVRRHDGGTTWTTVDGGSLNKSTGFSAASPFAAVYDNQLYIAWEEIHATNGKSQIRVKSSSDGTTWAFVDGGGAEGLNFDATKDANSPKLAVFDSKLFLAFGETDGTAGQIRVKYYDGSSWAWADGNASTGINFSTSRAAGLPFLVTFNSRLFAIWNETNGTADQIRVKQYGGGSTWSSADGGVEAGLNSVATQVSYYPWAYVFASKLYVIWHEYFTTNYNIMVKAGS